MSDAKELIEYASIVTGIPVADIARVTLDDDCVLHVEQVARLEFVVLQAPSWSEAN